MQNKKEKQEKEKRQTVKQVKRSQVSREQTWDMTSVFPSIEAWETSFAEVASKKGAMTQYQGRLSESADTLLEAIKSREVITDNLMRLLVYAFHRSDEDTADPTFLAMKGRVGALLAALMGEDAWFEPELANIPQE
ncbi:MAG TPA: hypothetical protein VFD19_03230, partial [Clostridia bacterium]|nr:hypothetical protein [Clostridia bacterium]